MYDNDHLKPRRVLPLQRLADPFEHFLRSPLPVDFDDLAPLTVVFDDRVGLLTVHSEAFADRLFGIVFPLNQAPPALVTDTLRRRGIELDVEVLPAVFTDPTSRESIDEGFLTDVEIKDGVQIRSLGEELRLIQVSWIPVENESIGVVQGCDEDLVYYGIRNEFARIHVLGGLPVLRLHLFVLPERITRRDVIEVVFRGKPLTLGPFPRSWGTDYQDPAWLGSAHARSERCHAKECAESGLRARARSWGVRSRAARWGARSRGFSRPGPSVGTVTRFDAADPTARRKLFADAIVAHRERGGPFVTIEAAPAEEPVEFGEASQDGENDDEEPRTPPWVQFADRTFNMDCTEAELDRLKSLLEEYPEFRIDKLESPDDAEGTNVRVTARSDANRLADFVERSFREVYEQPDSYRAWVTQV